MPYDSKLVEAVARAECRVEGVDADLECVGLGNLIPVGEIWPAWKVRARRVEAALRAIDASGTYWVAPWDDPHSMPGSPVARDYAETRDVCLSERREEGR